MYATFANNQEILQDCRSLNLWC